MIEEEYEEEWLLPTDQAVTTGCSFRCDNRVFVYGMEGCDFETQTSVFPSWRGMQHRMEEASQVERACIHR